MDRSLIVVDGYVAVEGANINLREEAWEFALDQRCFGPRRLVVAFAGRDGQLRSISHAERTEPPELALAPCIAHSGRGAAAAIAYCDEPVSDGPPPPDLAERFARARSIASYYSVHLVDWIACDDFLFRSARHCLEPGREWWDLP